MGKHFASEICLTCCQKSINFHKISDSDGDTNISHIICQYFWFKEDDLRSAIVCETCWEKVDQFHRFYLDVKKLHEQREEALLSMFIKQEEIEIEDAQLQENDIHTLVENQKLFDIADCKLEEYNELPEKKDLVEVFPQPRKKRKYARRLPNQSIVKNTQKRVLTLEERQAEDDFIKQHTRYICDECNNEFENFPAIISHRIKAHKKDHFVCCGIQYRRRSILYEHVLKKLNPEAFKCEVCGKSFKFKNGYVRHKKENHAAEEDLVFKCNRCPKSFIKEGLLKSHLGEHETLENETAKCELCGKCFRTKSSLNKHVKDTHKKPMDFICEVCSKGFYLRWKFLEHHKTHELTAEQLKEQCPVCNKWFKNHTNWLQHVRRHKGGECKCEVCGHVSINMMSLKVHIKNMHAPDRKRHVCEQCGKEYSRAIYLKEHVANVHTGEHLHQCQHCEEKFCTSAKMYSHKKFDHPQEWLQDRMSRFTRGEEVSDGDEKVF